MWQGFFGFCDKILAVHHLPVRMIHFYEKRKAKFLVIVNKRHNCIHKVRICSHHHVSSFTFWEITAIDFREVQYVAHFRSMILSFKVFVGQGHKIYFIGQMVYLRDGCFSFKILRKEFLRVFLSDFEKIKI